MIYGGFKIVVKYGGRNTVVIVVVYGGTIRWNSTVVLYGGTLRWYYTVVLYGGSIRWYSTVVLYVVLYEIKNVSNWTKVEETMRPIRRCCSRTR